MKDIISRLSKKPLSQVVTILTGIEMIIYIINKYTVINIKTDYFDSISIDRMNPSFSELLILSLILFSFVLFEVFRSIFFKHLPPSIIDDDVKTKKVHTMFLTIGDICDLMSSLSGFLLIFICNNCKDIDSTFYFLIHLFIIIKFCIIIFRHFYYKNGAIVNKILKK